MNDFDKRWQRISQLLSMEATGKERPMFSSGRTLFGIKSTAEEKMDQFAREIEEEHAAKRKAAREAEYESERETECEGQHKARHGTSIHDTNCETGTNPAPSLASDHQAQPLPSASPSPRFSASTAFIRSSVEELTDRALKQAIRDANKKLEDDYQSGKITKRKKFNAD